MAKRTKNLQPKKPRAPKPAPAGALSQKKPGPKSGWGGPHHPPSALRRAMGGGKAHQSFSTFKVPVVASTGRFASGGPMAPPHAPPIRAAHPVAYGKRHLAGAPQSLSPPALPSRPRAAKADGLSGDGGSFMRRDGDRPFAAGEGWNALETQHFAGPSSIPGDRYLGGPGVQDAYPSPPEPTLPLVGDVVPSLLSWHLPGVVQRHNISNITDIRTAQTAQLQFGCMPGMLCASTHSCLDYACSQSTTDMNNAHRVPTNNLPEWQPPLSMQQAPVQRHWPQYATGPWYPQPEFDPGPSIEPPAAHWNSRAHFECTYNQLGPIAPDTWQQQIAVHPAPAPVQGYWSQDNTGTWYYHQGYPEQLPLQHASAGFGLLAAAYKDFGASSMAPDTFPYYGVNTAHRAFEPAVIREPEWPMSDRDHVEAQGRPTMGVHAEWGTGFQFYY
ncbi:hypothetical protein C2E23DRAFT_885496 [Lenzites betulinus]|nr:hypothetical protein C2E23DRAFT_885496 [Lenzites betulinus]